MNVYFYIINVIVSKMSEKEILDKNVINFYSKKKEFNSLSNFWENPIITGDGSFYQSGEHCFHGEKYKKLGNISNDINRKKELLKYSKKFLNVSEFKTPNIAKKMGGKSGLKLTEEELKTWEVISIKVQEEICVYKVKNYSAVREDLKKSHNKILVHSLLRVKLENLNTRIWEGKAIIKNGEIEIIGKNLLGKIWMKIREDYIKKD